MTDFFMRKEEWGKASAPEKTKTRCLRCGESNVPVVPVGLGGVGFCESCIVEPGGGWNIRICPYCSDPSTNGFICEDCRSEAFWRLLEYRLAKGRGAELDRCGYVGADRRKAHRERRKHEAFLDTVDEGKAKR